MSKEFKKLIRKRGGIERDFKNCKKFVDSMQDALSAQAALSEDQVAELQDRIDKISLLDSQFVEAQNEIEVMCSDDRLEEQYEERDKFIECCSSTLARAKVLLKKLTKNDSISDDSSSVAAAAARYVENIQLPKINLIKFDGSYAGWIEFRDTFQSLIHESDSLKEIQKFHYLRASLEGDALQIIQSLEFTADNYKEAWELLCVRFNKPKLLINNHVVSLFSLQTLTKESAKGLRNLWDGIAKHLRALKSMGQPTDQWDTLIIHIASSRLDKVTAREWEKHITANDSPTLKEFETFMRYRADFLEKVESNVVPKANESVQRSIRRVACLSSNSKCNFCEGDHIIYYCDEFKKLNVNSRIAQSKGNGLCINCLAKGHTSKDCKSAYRCRTCKAKHNTLLHIAKETSSTLPNTKDNVPSSNATISSFVSNNTNVLLSTAVVNVLDSHGKIHHVRILLDSGSQSNFVTEKCAQKLGLKRDKIEINVMGLANSLSQVNSKCTIKLMATHSAFNVDICCLIIPVITGTIPNRNLDISHLKIPSNVRLADSNFQKPGEVDILVGASCFFDLLCIGQISLGEGQLKLQKTRFGWVVGGQVSSPSAISGEVRCNFVRATSSVEDQIAKFWQIEEIPAEKPLSVEENECENHFVRNTARDENGRFIVKIPLKESPSKLGDSYHQAKKRLLSLEKRFKSDDTFRVRYSQFMDEYAELGHMTISQDFVENSFYLPHHGVTREDKVSTKLRVVFNGSATTDTGYSLNDLQMVGPVIQRDLFEILLDFRSYTYVFAADIEKMYRQVMVCHSQRHLQRVLWRASPDDKIEIYDINRLVYGTASASFLAIRSLCELGFACKDTHPNVSKIILHNFYVDDLLAGTNSLVEAQEICAGVTDILNSGCFPLRKWISNDLRVLKDIKPEYIHPQLLSLGSSECAKTLGIAWFFESDYLVYSISPSPSEKVTKRIILSELSQTFDPLGLLGPVTVVAKILMQQLWLQRLDWDESIPLDIHQRWVQFRSELLELNTLKIPRHAICDNPKSVEIHGFCDASTSAYGGCVYVRSVAQNDTVVCHLLCSKSRVAPLKTITVPRLELSGALTLSRLVEGVLKSLSFKPDNVYLWTDSTVVLGWIKTQPNLLKTFVAHRVAEIQSLTSTFAWFHVPTDVNPSDLLSRGILPSQIHENALWWNAPDFLYLEKSQWPSLSQAPTKLPELKKNVHVLTSSDVERFPFENYSSLNRLKRVIAFCLRFKHNCLNPTDRRTCSLSRKELDESLLCLIKISKRESFPNEYKMLKLHKTLISSSNILSLSPFLGDDGFIRVGGRIQNSDFEFSKKHPFLLSGEHRLSRLIFEQEHKRLLHAGPQLLLFTVRESFWIINGRNIARKVVRECVRCFRCSPRGINPVMGNLPKDRISQSSPFAVVGTDYAGPLSIKDKKGRGSKTLKCYICVFICFVTKAIHIELVSDLTSNCFILALKRFVSRRGKPSKIYSDNGTTYVGANSKMKEMLEFIRKNNKELTDIALDHGIEWHFIPPQSPHFGGLWEAGVKSIKHHLRRVAGNALLTFEELYTLLSQVESILNSRPLSPLSSDPNDLSCLTPADFLVGRPLTTISEADVTTKAENRLQHYERVEQIFQHFWKRWHLEYISELQRRAKWQKSDGDALQLQQLVLVKEDGVPPLRWRLGRVTQVHPGKDGLIRAATVRTSSATIQRSFAKLCPLPLQ